jgi:hypothetical protein
MKLRSTRHFLISLVSLLAIGMASMLCPAEGDTAEKSAKKAVREVKDKTCEMVHGKLHCTAKKIKHKTQNAIDDAK